MKMYPKIEIRNKKGHEEQLSAGTNMEVLIDGVLLKGITKIHFEVEAGGVAKVTTEMLGIVQTNMVGELKKLKT